MSEKERFIKALKREPIEGFVPHFELVFFLTMEAFGKVHPTHRRFAQWDQMSREEKKAQIKDIARVYVDTAEKYHHSAIFVQMGITEYDRAAPVLEAIREISGDKYFVMLHSDPTFPIPDGETMYEFTADLYEKPEKVHDKAKSNMEAHISGAKKFEKTGLLDGCALCSDYCFNTNPFYSIEMFDEFIVPYLKEILRIYRELGYYSIKHTDGNIMPILRQMVDCNPDAIHSLDPQGGVDLGEVKRLVGKEVCLIGNVNCGLLQTGTKEECIADVMRSLKQGMDGYGYIFSTSNCVYTGLPLKRYELMLDVWKKHGVYKGNDSSSTLIASS